MKTAAIAWAFFVITGIFVSLIVPLGEGFDEPWHFGYIQYVAQTGTLPPGPHLHLSLELEKFLSLHPMGWRLREIFPTLRTQEEYWGQSDAVRSTGDEAIRSLRFSGKYVEASPKFTEQYESHQAPLYYFVGALPFLVLSRFLSFTDTFLLIRIGSLLLASSVVPLSYCLANRVSTSNVTPQGVAVLVATFPGLYPDIARVSNDALAVPLAAAVFLALARFLETRSTASAIVLGLALLAGLSTKAFFVPVVIAIVATLIAAKHYRASLTVAIVSGVGSIWYLRNAWITGSMTGLPETVSANSTIASSIQSVGTIRWLDVLRLASVSHIWMGYWSLLQYRSWIYEIIIILFGIGLVGFVLHFRQSRSPIAIALCVVYAAYSASLIYYATQVFQQTGIPVIQGWYLSPLVPIEAMVFVTGVQFLLPRWHSWIIVAVAVCFLAMIIYGNGFIAAPYYSGLIKHGRSGSLSAYHPRLADTSTMDSRLVRFHPWIPAATPLVLGLFVLLTGFFLIWTYYTETIKKTFPL
jgi:hypothetical protein